MKLQISPYSLQFHFPFGVHGNSRTHTRSVFVRLLYHDFEAFGEACLPPYLGQKEANTLRFLRKAADHLSSLQVPPLPLYMRKILKPIPGQEDAGMAAVDMALNDLHAKMNKKSYREWKNLPIPQSRQTAFTIGLGPMHELPDKIRQAKDFHILKIKLNGTEADKTLIRNIRSLTEKHLFADLNQACKKKETALELIHWLKDNGVVLVEQALPVDHYDESAWLCEKSPLPIIADESIRNYEDLKRYYACFSGLNLKLMKCGGMDQAMEMILFAKQKGLKLMLGCMAESSCGTTAMAQFMGHADYIDLDAPLLYQNDPFSGLYYKDGEIYLPEAHGIGSQPKSQLLWSE